MITFSNRWHIAWLSIAPISMKMSKMGQLVVSHKNVLFFQRGIQMLPEKWEKVEATDGQYFQ